MWRMWLIWLGSNRHSGYIEGVKSYVSIKWNRINVFHKVVTYHAIVGDGQN